jgi:dephospho-CoA kinase
MKLVVTVGMPGSGKDELIQIARRMGFHVLKMGDLVREEVQKRGLPLTVQNVARVASEERDKNGPSIWAKRAVPRITETRTLVDGCRGDAEINVFRHHFGDLTVVGIFASPETRYERIARRGRGDDGMSLEDFYERDRRELKWGIGNAFALADHMIVNEGTLEDLERQARQILAKVLAKDDE